MFGRAVHFINPLRLSCNQFKMPERLGAFIWLDAWLSSAEDPGGIETEGCDTSRYVTPYLGLPPGQAVHVPINSTYPLTRYVF